MLVVWMMVMRTKGRQKKQMVAGQVSFKLSTVDMLTAWLPSW